ncbi:MAG: hypothetical protein SLAVMIC_01013 [uncultured marine phage]|uniref:Uncharacterized protein n=1 Tax=uncultured marine phage TaxID=707152 RepID=A0A8D9CCI1_9VIRU|nr:MAG: hypothetical protein SLAVMIC_01013 [uncultured marine phage]
MLYCIISNERPSSGSPVESYEVFTISDLVWSDNIDRGTFNRSFTINPCEPMDLPTDYFSEWVDLTWTRGTLANDYKREVLITNFDDINNHFSGCFVSTTSPHSYDINYDVEVGNFGQFDMIKGVVTKLFREKRLGDVLDKNDEWI